MEVRNCDKWSYSPKDPACDDADDDGWCAPLDCGDTNVLVNHGSPEKPGNSLDDDCDGTTDEPANDSLDQDKDGYTPLQGDCNDYNAAVNPGALEEPDDGLDNDCDGTADENTCTCTPNTGSTLEAMACAAEISCNTAAFKTQGISSPTGDDLSSNT